jgi:hypothetical protein
MIGCLEDNGFCFLKYFWLYIYIYIKIIFFIFEKFIFNIINYHIKIIKKHKKKKEILNKKNKFQPPNFWTALDMTWQDREEADITLRLLEGGGERGGQFTTQLIFGVLKRAVK